MTITAHRCDCYNWYENTMTAFEKAIQAGAVYGDKLVTTNNLSDAVNKLKGLGL